MSNISEEYICAVVSKIATACNLELWQYSVLNFENIGQNYFGVIIPVSLTGSNNVVKDMVFNVVLKLAPTDERFRVSGAITAFFLREILVYSKLFVKYREIQIQFPVHLQFIMPKEYFTSDEYCKEVIAMENMLILGYKPYVHKMFLDFAHITVALKSLAKFHALSFIMKENDYTLYDEIAKTCLPLSEKSNKRFMDIMRDRLDKALCKFEGTKYVPLLDSLKLNCATIFDKAIELVKGICLAHGDIWKENVLFKYEENVPVSSCLIDYQTTRTSSPAFDVLFLITSSTDSSLRQRHFHSLLDIYYETFSDVLNEVSLESKNVYSYESLKYDLKIVAPSCLITANTALWLSNGLQEEGHVRSKHIWKTPEEKEIAVDIYRNIIKSIIDDYYDYGYLPVEYL